MLQRIAPLFAVALFLASVSAASAAEGEAVGLEYTAPEACADEAHFVAAVADRGSQVSDGDERSPLRVLVVKVEATSDGFLGALHMREDGQDSGHREVQAPSCADVVDALAVVAAILLRSKEEAATVSGTPVDSSRQKPSEASERPQQPRESNPSFFRGRSRIGSAARHQRIAVQAGTLNLDTHSAFTLYAGPTFGLIPNTLLPRYDLSAHGASFLTLPSGAQTLLGVARLRLSALGPALHESGSTRTELLGASLGMSMCLSPEYNTRGWVLLFCAEYGGGVLQIDVMDGDGANPRSKTHGFGTVGVSGEAQYNLSSLFHLGFKLGWDAYMGEITAERSDGSRIFEAATNTATVSLGLGVHF